MYPKRTSYLLVPVELCKFAITEHIESPFHTFLLLKYWSDGYFKIDPDLLDKLAINQDKSTRTVRRYIRKLISVSFITPSKEPHFHITSWKDIQKRLKINYTTGVKSYPESINDSQAFCAGAVIGRLANERRLKLKVRRKTVQERKTRTPSSAYPSFQECATRALAQICGISISKAHKLKHKAFSEKYIHLKKNFTPIIIDGVKVKLNKSDLAAFREIYPEHPQVQIRNGYAYSVSSDLVWSKMKYKRSQNFL